MSNSDPVIKLHRVPQWLLDEPVDVTLVIDDPNKVLTVYLIARRSAPGAVTVHYSENGITVNGASAGETEAEAMFLCEVADAARSGMTEYHFDGWSNIPVLKLGTTVRIDPQDIQVVGP